jgi:hypothetical protein
LGKQPSKALPGCRKIVFVFFANRRIKYPLPGFRSGNPGRFVLADNLAEFVVGVLLRSGLKEVGTSRMMNFQNLGQQVV